MEIKDMYLAEYHTVEGEPIYTKIATVSGNITDKDKRELKEMIEKIGGSEMANEIVKVGEKEMTVKEYKGVRVVTFKDIDSLHNVKEGVSRRNFANNREKFVEQEDFFLLTPENAKCVNFTHCENVPPKGITLITESGYLMLVKSLTDDLSWKVQRQLVNGYFKARRTEKIIDTVQTQPDTTQILNYIMRELEKVKKEIRELKKEGAQLPLFDIADLSDFRSMFIKTVKQITVERNCPLQYSEIYKRLEKETGKKYREEAEKEKILIIDYIERVGDIGRALAIAEKMLKNG